MRNWKTKERVACGLLLAMTALTTVANAENVSAEPLPAVEHERAIEKPTENTGNKTALNSEQLERSLQQLDWPKFKSVIEAIPKLKADVDAYGALGWQIVRGNYQSYSWRKNIDKLDEAQKAQLAALIEKSKSVSKEK